MGRIERERQIKELHTFKKKVEKTDTPTLNEERSILAPKHFIDYLDLERMGKFYYLENVLEKREVSEKLLRENQLKYLDFESRN